jgi:CubicO group peptidase (beta-lactamase class C family)
MTYGLIAVAAYVAYTLLKKGIFSPAGMTKTGLENVASRQNAPAYSSTYGTPATYIQVGSTTYQIRDSELSQTGFIRRRAALGELTGLNAFNWFNNWVYS